MNRHVRLALAPPLAFVTLVVASPGAIGQTREGQPGMFGTGATDRAGQPATMLSPPPAEDPNRARLARFAAAYARARSPRVVVFWNRELTDDLESDREDVTTFASSSRFDNRAHGVEYATRRADHTRVSSSAESSTEGEIRSTSRRVDEGRRASPHDEVVDFDMERGFSDALASGGVRLIDRTAILRSKAVQVGTTNVQTAEALALGDKAELLLEVVPMAGPDEAGTQYRIVARDIASGRIMAQVRSGGRIPIGKMPYVAGERGFVRASPRPPSPLERGRQMAMDVMAALSSSL